MLSSDIPAADGGIGCVPSPLSLSTSALGCGLLKVFISD
jgi:hypothetical protein